MSRSSPLCFSAVLEWSEKASCWIRWHWHSWVCLRGCPAWNPVYIVWEVMAGCGSWVCRQIAMVWAPFVPLGWVFPHSVTTYVGSRQERLPEEVALRLHLTIMNKKHFRSRESSQRAGDTEDTVRGSNRQGEGNAPSTLQLFGDHAETVGR